MPREDSSGPADWLAHAHEDLLVARILLERGEALHTAGYHIQQGVEKALKASVLAQGQPVRRTHDLEELLDEAIEGQPGLERYRDLCETGSAFHLAGRYPGVVPEPMDEDQLSSLLSEAEALVHDVESALPS